MPIRKVLKNERTARSPLRPSDYFSPSYRSILLDLRNRAEQDEAVGQQLISMNNKLAGFSDTVGRVGTENRQRPRRTLRSLNKIVRGLHISCPADRLPRRLRRPPRATQWHTASRDRT